MPRRLSQELLITAIAVTAVVLGVTDPTFLVVGVSIGLAVVAVLRFDVFVYALVFLLPWYPVLDFKPPFRDVFLLSRFVLLAGVWLVRRREGKSVHDWVAGSRLKQGVLLLAGIAAVSLLIAEEHANLDAYRSLVRLFSYVAVFFAFAGWVETRQQVTTVIKVLLVSTIGVALFGFYQVVERSYTDLYFHLYPLQEDALEPWNGRITSLLFHFNFLAGYLNLALALSLAWMTWAKSSGERILGMVCHGMAGAALYFTGSRGGVIAYAGMLLISFFFLTPKRSSLLRVLLAMILAASIVLSLQEKGAAVRLQEIDEYTQVTRFALWQAAGRMFLSHPILGVGYGNYRSLYHNYIPTGGSNDLDAHNLYLQFLAETGAIGFLIFCGLAFAFARVAIKLARRPDPYDRLIGVGVGGGLAATLIHGMTDYIFNVSPQSGALLWMVLALGLVAYEHAAREARPAQRGLTESAGASP